MNDLTHTLQQLGYPLCPGNVMVNNPKWVHSEQEWKQTLTGWVKKATPDTVVDIAIMADAHAVAGNRDLLLPVKQHLSDLILGQELILTEFCRPALNFSVPLTLFGITSSKALPTSLCLLRLFIKNMSHSIVKPPASTLIRLN